MAGFKLTDIKVRQNFKELAKALDEIPGNKKIRYAIAMNRMVDDCRDHAREDFDENFHQRGNGFMRRGIVSYHAKSSKLVARVGTINSLMGLHLKGGRKTGNVAMEGIRGSDGSGMVTKTTRVENLEKLIAKKTRTPKKYFKMKLRGQEYIMAKTGETHERKLRRKGKIKTSPVYDRGPITPMWLLMDKRRIKIKADWQLEDVVEKRMTEAGPEIIRAILEDSWDHAVEKGRLSGANPYKLI